MKNFNNFIKNKSLKNSNAINDILIKHLVIYLNTLKPVKIITLWEKFLLPRQNLLAGFLFVRVPAGQIKKRPPNQGKRIWKSHMKGIISSLQTDPVYLKTLKNTFKAKSISSDVTC